MALREVTTGLNRNYWTIVVFTNSKPGKLKVCKTAGKNVAVGTPFDFALSNGETLTIPAGPAPGGYCQRADGPFQIGSVVEVIENAGPGTQVTGITIAPADHEVSADLDAALAEVEIGLGFTEVNFTNDAKTEGYLEICKTGAAVQGNFDFTVQPDNLGPFTVAVGQCSPAIQVTAGDVDIIEAPDPSGTTMGACSAYPATHQLACDPASRTSTVRVLPGDITNQTIAFIENTP